MRCAIVFVFTLATACVAVVGLGRPALATPRSATFHIPVAAPDPVFTGHPEDLATPGWKSAYEASAFTNFDTRRPDAYGTDAYVVFGKTGLFVALDCRQEHATITATQTTDDVGSYLDDYAGVGIDTTGSGELDYYFETTPKGTRFQQSSESSRYHPAWRTATSHDATSWYAELYIPFAVLRRTGARSQHWRMNFFRHVAATREALTWAYNPGQGSFYEPQEWPSVTDISIDLAVKRANPNAEVYGLADVGHDRRSFEGSAGQLVSQTPRIAGIDAKIPLTGTLNLVGTLDPDFSNVESDQQLTTPQEFRRQYSEYRPFFAEGANFLPSADVFYSPNVGIFDHGEKVEGEIAGASIGLLNVTGFHTNSSAFQIRDLRDDDQLGVSLAGAFDHVQGASDEILKTSVNYTNQYSKFGISGDYAIDRGSTVTAPARGDAWDVFASESRPNYTVNAGYVDTGATYAPIDGFVTQNDIRGYQVGGTLAATQGASTIVKDASISAEGDRYLDGTGGVRLADDYVYGVVDFRDRIEFSSAVEDSQLKSYARAFPDYIGATIAPYDTNFVSLGFLQGTPHAFYGSLTWGRFGNAYLQQTLGQIQSPLSKHLSVTVDFQKSLERFDAGAPSDGQVLRRVSFFESISGNESATLSYRIVSGRGGGALPGSNLAIGYLKRTPHGNEIIVEIGSPAAPVTQNRFIVKYVQLVGSGVGL